LFTTANVYFECHDDGVRRELSIGKPQKDGGSCRARRVQSQQDVGRGRCRRKRCNQEGGSFRRVSRRESRRRELIRLSTRIFVDLKECVDRCWFVVNTPETKRALASVAFKCETCSNRCKTQAFWKAVRRELYLTRVPGRNALQDATVAESCSARAVPHCVLLYQFRVRL
jgi:hypothetical protein